MRNFTKYQIDNEYYSDDKDFLNDRLQGVNDIETYVTSIQLFSDFLYQAAKINNKKVYTLVCSKINKIIVDIK